ncbi:MULTISPECIES: hypothetical protein [unclassified Nocardioides]|uniref:hypothetical protein n=1 Tax=unclassified Nocardioides TaxID=2615069 RepID=UPI0036084958
MSTLVDAPVRVDGVQFIGEMVGSGYRTPPSLVRRADGQVLQLTPLLYLVLRAVDGRSSCAEIAQRVGRAMGRSVTATDIATLIDTRLRPLGLLRQADGSEPAIKRSDPLLGLKPRFAVTSPRATRWLTDPFRFLFRPAIAAVFVVGFAAVAGWVFFERGLGASAYDAFERPHLLLLVFAVTVLSGGLHEFGHAAAARYSGAQPGAMGAGLYLVWPAFYTDVTDSYRLGRAGRIRTDLGGLYFNAIVVVLTFVWWWATGWEALLLLVATQVLQMMQQLLPLLRFDGYHLLADLAGVPDLYHRIRPTLVGLLPHRWRSPENRVLTPRARFFITLWVLLTVPMLALMLYAVIAAVPRLLGSAGSVLRADAAAVGRAWGAGNPLDVSAGTLQVLGVALPVLACGLILCRVGLRFFGGLARWSRGSFIKRVAATAASVTVVTALLWAWWPHPGVYRPIEPGERGLVTSLFQPPEAELTSASTAGGPLVSSGGVRAAAMQAQSRLSEERLVVPLEEGTDLPTRDDPRVVMVLMPRTEPESDLPVRGTRVDPRQAPAGDSAGSSVAAPGEAQTTAPAGSAPDQPAPGPWVFPFDQPLPPAEGDNQALAVNTADDSVVYDVAFALVWATGDEVLNVNEAHAYASCSNCVAVAVAFQVVLVLDDARVIVPQNLAVAANYDCYQCITAAIASQLVLSVEEEPGQAQLLALDSIWDELVAFASSITAYSITEITDVLETFQAEITALLRGAPTVEAEPSPTTSDPPDAGEPTTPTTPDSSSPTGQATTGPSAPSPTSSSPSSPTSTTPADPTSEPTSPTPTEPSASPSSTAESPTDPPSTSSPTESTSPTPPAESSTPSPIPSP